MTTTEEHEKTAREPSRESGELQEQAMLRKGKEPGDCEFYNKKPV